MLANYVSLVKLSDFPYPNKKLANQVRLGLVALGVCSDCIVTQVD